jgi:hypothetical protein
LGQSQRLRANPGGDSEKNQNMSDVKSQLAQHPDDFELHRKVDHGLATARRFAEVVELWDGYIANHPSDPRAYLERGGAKWHLKQRPQAIADVEKACQLGMDKACADVPRMKARAGL